MMPPNCPTCGCCAKENMANFKKFFYCEECKVEVPELLLEDEWGPISYFNDDFDPDTMTPEQQKAYDDWLDGITPKGNP